MAEENKTSGTSDGTGKRKKLRFKKTETSRLKTAGAGEQPSPADEAQVPPPQASGEQAEQKVDDPMALRDTHTSKVRRVQAGKDTGPTATAVPPGSVDELKKTETVHLKVVQQKKKEIADMMSPGSTVRLRAPGVKKSGPAPAAKKGTERDTIKVSPPEPRQPADKEPAEAPAPSSTVKAEKPSEKKTSTQALKKVTAKSADDDAEKTTAVPPPAAEQAGEADSGEKAATGRQTLKLRGTGKAGRTVKVPSGKDAAAGTVQLKRGRDGTETQELPAPQGVPGAVPGVPGPAPRTAAGAQPGVMFTLAAVAAAAALGVAVFFMITQLMTHIVS